VECLHQLVFLIFLVFSSIACSGLMVIRVVSCLELLNMAFILHTMWYVQKVLFSRSWNFLKIWLWFCAIVRLALAWVQTDSCKTWLNTWLVLCHELLCARLCCDVLILCLNVYQYCWLNFHYQLTSWFDKGEIICVMLVIDPICV